MAVVSHDGWHSGNYCIVFTTDGTIRVGSIIDDGNRLIVVSASDAGPEVGILLKEKISAVYKIADRLD